MAGNQAKEAEGVSLASIHSTQKTPKYIESPVIEAELAPPQPAQLLKLTIEALANLVENVAVIIKTSGESELQKTRETLLSSKNSALLLQALNSALSVAADESSIQSVLNCYQSYIFVTGTAKQFKVRDLFISSLCQHCSTKTSDCKHL